LAQSGAHLALNAAAAAAAALAAGVSIEQVACGLERATVSGGRSELTRTATGALLLDDSYNANPTSLAAALDTLVALAVSGRRVAVLGLMAELGPEGPAQHRQLADRAQSMGIEVLAVDTDAYGIPAVGPEEALARLRSLGPGDGVLVKASRAVGLDRLVTRLKA
jgi:UDP-N-acetylmuramoyl-tripeptide--D-alanyl-D-alanine ligase